MKKLAWCFHLPTAKLFSFLSTSIRVVVEQLISRARRPLDLEHKSHPKEDSRKIGKFSK